MDESVYLNLAKADILCALSKRTLSIDDVKYLNRQLNDVYKTHIMIFEIYRNLNMNFEIDNIEHIESKDKDFIHDVLNVISEVCGCDVDMNFHYKIWLYSTYLKFNSNISNECKGEYLKSISPSLNVDKYFLLEYYNCLMDNIMQNIPIKIDELEEVKNNIRKLI